jgi:ankyrin repeat protein
MATSRRLITACGFLALTLSGSGQLQDREEPREIRDASVGFPFRVTQESRSTIGPATWFVFARLSERHYSRENLERIWRYFCNKYQDKSQKLDLRIYVDRTSHAPSATQSSVGEKSQQDFVANFLRQGDGALAGGGENEILIYHPDLDRLQELERIVLKGKDPFNPYAYTGGRDVDFVAAAARGDKEKFESLLIEGVNINARNRFQDTALTEASTSGYLDLVELLLAKGADVNAKNENGWTPLICAASQGQNEIVKLLLEKGAIRNAKNSLGMSALSRSIYDGQVDTFKLLLSRGAEIEFKDELGETPLLLALGGHSEIARILLNRAVDVNSQTITGETPLMRAQFEDLVITLLDKGATLNARDKYGNTALFYAARIGNLPKVQLLLSRGVDLEVKNNRLGDHLKTGHT